MGKGCCGTKAVLVPAQGHCCYGQSLTSVHLCSCLSKLRFLLLAPCGSWNLAVELRSLMPALQACSYRSSAEKKEGEESQAALEEWVGMGGAGAGYLFHWYHTKEGRTVQCTAQLAESLPRATAQAAQRREHNRNQTENLRVGPQVIHMWHLTEHFWNSDYTAWKETDKWWMRVWQPGPCHLYTFTF